MVIIAGIISIVCTILCIILFFKIWGMCNDVSDIRYYLHNMNKPQAHEVQQETPQGTETIETTQQIVSPQKDDSNHTILLIVSIGIVIWIVILCIVATL